MIRWVARGVLLLVVVVLAAAAAAAAEARVDERSGASSAAEVVLSTGLGQPSSLAFNPHDGSLWVVSRRGLYDTTTVITDVDRAAATSRVFVDTSAHYLVNPTQIAFSPTRNEFATSAEDGGGPTLWPADRSLFNGSRASHLDMVHYSQPALGVAAGADAEHREYWVVNGRTRGIDRYFFNEPHEPGGQNHSDGLVYRYVQGSLRPSPTVAPGAFRAPSHAVFDRASGTLYVADTGNGRIVRFRTGAVPPDAKFVERLGGVQERLFTVSGGRVATVVRNLRQPAGLLLKDGHLIVGEYETGRIRVYTLGGRLGRTVDTGLGKNALAGLAAAPDGRIYFLDARRHRLLRLKTPASLP